MNLDSLLTKMVALASLLNPWDYSGRSASPAAKVPEVRLASPPRARSVRPRRIPRRYSMRLINRRPAW